MRILLTNDDGIDAPGIHALYQAVADLGEVHVIGPAKAQSAMGHAVTFDRPIRVRDHRDPTFTGLSVDGRPADCVKLGLASLIEQPVDLVLSGMNAGANVGINVMYSGTVGAAVEGAFNGIPAVAVSLHIGQSNHTHWDRAGKLARRAIDRLLDEAIEPGTVMNLNVPMLDHGVEPRGETNVPLSMSPMVCHYEHHQDGDGSTYQIDDTLTFERTESGTDVAALFEGYTTITPLQFNLTHHSLLAYRDASSET